MDLSEFKNHTMRETNQQWIESNNEYQKAIQGMKEIEAFLDDFDFLVFGSDMVLCKKHLFSIRTISTAIELTAGSIISCCEAGCLADAFTLLRKYRDDLFFLLYIVVYIANKREAEQTKITDKMENDIDRWMNNNLCDLSIGKVLKAIGQSSQVTDAVKKYNMQNYFDTIERRLNDYVHSNGISYYNQNIIAYRNNELKELFDSLLNDMRLITVTFMFLLTLCSPLSIMSSDYVDCLECNMTPPEGSQYWVAPYITEFFRKNMDLIDKSCIDYLRENTSMEIE